MYKFELSEWVVARQLQTQIQQIQQIQQMQRQMQRQMQIDYEHLDLPLGPKTQQTTTRQVHKILPPDRFCVQYIGGPNNSEQEFREYAVHRETIREGTIYRITVPTTQGHILPSGRYISPILETFSYLLTFVPMAQTPFLGNTQLVIAIYQEK